MFFLVKSIDRFHCIGAEVDETNGLDDNNGDFVDGIEDVCCDNGVGLDEIGVDTFGVCTKGCDVQGVFGACIKGAFGVCVSFIIMYKYK